MYAWAGKLLRVNLSDGTMAKEPINPDLARDFIGSRGLATKYLFDELAPGAEPLSPENKLIFAAGPLTGTMGITSGRYTVVTKSPLTGAIAASNAGGNWAPELKYAGYDLVIVEGRAKDPVYLWIRDGRVEIRSAGHLWGKTVGETDRALIAETDPEARVACIGPAGERLSLIANVINEAHRAAGRSGVGAVMGSKNLKAIVVRGSGGVRVADPVRYRQAALDGLAAVKANPVTGQGLPAYGTAVLVNVINAHGALPTRNFQTGVFPEAEKVSGETLADTYLVRNKACFGCPISCGRVSRVKDGPYASFGDGPEYENIWALSSTCGVSDLAAVIKANMLCNDLGIDTISAGATVACAMELYEQGCLPKSEAGMELRFGDPDALIEAIRRLGAREGIGDVLAEGSYRLAERYGRPDLSMSAKKQEFPAYEPRGAKGIGLNYATSNRGGCHVRGYTIAPEILGSPDKIDPLASGGKAGWTKAFQDLTAVVDSAGFCLFITFALGVKEMLSLLNPATGIEYSEESILAAGERIWNLERLFNLREGLGRDDDSLPPRLTGEPMPEGPAKGQVVELEEMLREYYLLRGWDEQGRPTRARLAQLGLTAPDLEAVS